MSDIRELKILVDKEVQEYVRMRCFQLGLCALIENEYIPKSKLVGNFIELVLNGLSVGNLHNSYREMLDLTFKDKVTTKEPEMSRVFKKYGLEQSPRIIYNVIQQACYKEFGEFE